MGITVNAVRIPKYDGTAACGSITYKAHQLATPH